MQSFFADEDGAITIDWVVITAAIVGLQVILMVGMIQNSLVNVSENIGTKVDEYGEFIK